MSTRRHPVAWILGLATLGALAACGGPAGTAANGGTVIGPAGGLVAGPQGSQIAIPAGALSQAVGLTIDRGGSDVPALPGDGLFTAGAPFALTPHGTSFARPVTIRVPFDASRLPAEAAPTLYKAEVGGAFTPIPTTVDGQLLVADISDFSWVIPGYAAQRPRVVYALTGGSDAAVSSFAITPSTGALAPFGGPAPTGDAPTSVTVHPSRRFLLVTNAGASPRNGVAPSSLTVYGLDAVTGAVGHVIATRPATLAAVAAQPLIAAVHPTGRFVYVVNHQRFGGGSNSDVSLFHIDTATGALDEPVSVADSGGAPPTAIAFHPSGAFAYVTYIFATSTPVGNTYFERVKTFAVNPATGALSGPIGDAAGGSDPWAIVVDPAGKFAYVASQGSDEVRGYAIDGASGSLFYRGSTPVQSEPTSLAIDAEGRFLYVGKQEPFYNVNVEVFRIDRGNGGLSSTEGVLTGSGAQVGPIAVTAEPQAQYVYALDSSGELVSYGLDATSGLLKVIGPAATGFTLPGGNGVGVPFAFAAGGQSPVWEDGCTEMIAWYVARFGVAPPGGCFMPTLSSGTGGGSSEQPPPPAARHSLDVTIGTWGGSIVSSPAGIDYSMDDLSRNVSSAAFATGSHVTLCATTPAGTGRTYDITWTGTGGCGGTTMCTTVTMNHDEACRLDLTPR